MIAGVAGVALLIRASFYLASVVAGFTLDSMVGLSAGVDAAASVETSMISLATFGSGLTTTVEKAGQWISVLGGPIVLNIAAGSPSEPPGIAPCSSA